MGKIVKLLKELNVVYEYDIISFDALSDVVCGGSLFHQIMLIITSS